MNRDLTCLHDPVNGGVLLSVNSSMYSECVSMDQSDYDYQWLYTNARLIIDTRNATGVSLGDSKEVKA